MPLGLFFSVEDGSDLNFVLDVFSFYETRKHLTSCFDLCDRKTFPSISNNNLSFGELERLQLEC